MTRRLIGSPASWVGVLAAIALLLPLAISSPFVIDIFIRVLLFAFIGVAWNLMGGYAKQLSLGHAAYFGLGAYTSTILLIRFDISPWIGIVAGGMVAMPARCRPLAASSWAYARTTSAPTDWRVRFRLRDRSAG